MQGATFVCSTGFSRLQRDRLKPVLRTGCLLHRGAYETTLVAATGGAVGSRLPPSPCGRMGVAVAARRQLCDGRYRELLAPRQGHRSGRAIRIRREPRSRLPHAGLSHAAGTDFLGNRRPPNGCAPRPRRGRTVGNAGSIGGLGAYEAAVRRPCGVPGSSSGDVLPGCHCLRGVDPQRGSLLPVDLAATGAMGSRLERPDDRSEDGSAAWPAAWRPGRQR